MGCQQSAVANSYQNHSQHPYLLDPEQSALKANKPCRENLQLISRQLSGRQILLVNHALQKHILFYKLTRQQRLKVIQSMQKYRVRGQTYIFKQNDEPNYAFIINEGLITIQVKRSDKLIKRVFSQGDLFGDLALINVTSRTASAYADTDCELIGLSKQNFQSRMQQLIKDNQGIAQKYTNVCSIFSKFTNSQKKSIANNMYEARFQKGTVIFNYGELATCLYLIKSGQVEIRVPNRSSVLLKEGNIFGQSCLQKDSRRQGEAIALVTTHCFVITRSKLYQCVEQKDMKSLTFDCTLRWAMRRSVKFHLKPPDIIQKIIENGEIREIQDGYIIKSPAEEMEAMLICLEGQIIYDDIFRIVRPDQSIIGIGIPICEDGKKKQSSSFSLVKKGKGMVFSIKYWKINNILNQSTGTSTASSVSTPLQSPKSEQVSLQLKDLQYLDKYETNELGFVLLVRHCFTKKIYVLHCLIKNHIIDYKRQMLLIKSKQINHFLKEGYIVPLLKTYKDKNYVYFLYEYYINCTLETMYNQIGCFSQEILSFLIACLVIRLEYLHSKFIIYRDMQLQNWIVDQNGFPCMINFSMAKQLQPISGFKTYTIIGTPHFMAPEVHEGFGYSFAADIWSLGVLIYVLAIGQLPFGEGIDDPYQIFASIQTQKVAFPSNFSNKKIKRIIKKLLIKDSWSRPDLSTIKSYDLFSSLGEDDWKAIQNQTYKCPLQFQKQLRKDLSFVSKNAISLMSYLQKNQSNSSHQFRQVISSSWQDSI